MACNGNSLLNELTDLVNQIGNCSKNVEAPCCAPCCPPCNFPYAQVTMTCPPPILPPTRPEPVKPLQLPCQYPPFEQPLMTMEEREQSRYDNFYNSYNINWHTESPRYRNRRQQPECTEPKQMGQTLDGKSPCCDDLPQDCEDTGCPTGFKTCTMKLCPPPNCDPCGVWCAEIQPCPAKPKKPIFDPGDCYKKSCSKS